mmetsp:Transcript_42492/g.101110  ORF Transcript_42492/g.101110 Transcript_42492/m.101110 type:complete len:231 (+) Transcript_42492:21-713(+)
MAMTLSQWVIDPKVYIKPKYRTEYSSKTMDQAPNFLYKRVPPPDKNRSYGIQDPAGRKYPSTDQFKTTNSLTLLLDGTAGRPGYEKAEPFKVKEVQVQIGTGKGMAFTAPYSHHIHGEVDMRAANVRNQRTDGLMTAGDRGTKLPPWNPVPGVGGVTIKRCVFDAYEDTTDKYRDTRRFARMNNPSIPRGTALNIITGQIQDVKAPPRIELNPRAPVRPHLNSLAQVRPF